MLVHLSGTQIITPLFSNLNSALVTLWTGVGLVAGALSYMVRLSATRSRRPPREPQPRRTSGTDRLNWQMPALALLKPVQWSAGTKLGMGCYAATC